METVNTDKTFEWFYYDREQRNEPKARRVMGWEKREQLLTQDRRAQS